MGEKDWVVRAPAHPGPPPPRHHGLLDWSGWEECKHQGKEIRRRGTQGVVQYILQCLTCGKHCGCIARARIKVFAGIKLFDEDLAAAWNKRRTDYQMAAVAKMERELGHAQDRFNAWYAAYRQCREWIDKRAKVLERDRYVCQGCGGRATLAHHRTYERVGYELLIDLISVCESCHRELHPEHYRGVTNHS